MCQRTKLTRSMIFEFCMIPEIFSSALFQFNSSKSQFFWTWNPIKYFAIRPQEEKRIPHCLLEKRLNRSPKYLPVVKFEKGCKSLMYEMANDMILLMALGSHTVKMHMMLMLMTAAKPYQLYFSEVIFVRVSTSCIKKNLKPLNCLVILFNALKKYENRHVMFVINITYDGRW